jgi:hypothetical protein
LIVVKAELPVIASLGGALVGLQKERVVEIIGKQPLEEFMRDAIHEVFNVTATPLAEKNRVVFKTMHTDTAELGETAKAVLATPHQYTSFDVQVKGLLGGEYNIAYGRPND